MEFTPSLTLIVVGYKLTYSYSHSLLAKLPLSTMYRGNIEIDRTLSETTEKLSCRAYISQTNE